MHLEASRHHKLVLVAAVSVTHKSWQSLQECIHTEGGAAVPSRTIYITGSPPPPSLSPPLQVISIAFRDSVGMTSMPTHLTTAETLQRREPCSNSLRLTNFSHT